MSSGSEPSPQLTEAAIAPVGHYGELVERARGLIPILSKRTEQTQDLRRMLPETKQALEQAGVARLLQPSRYGGCEGHIFGAVEILTHVGSACGSTAWCLSQYIGHNFMLSQWPIEA